MAEHSKIEWTDATWPIVAGCEYVSPECTHCYAVYDSWRMAHNPNPRIHRVFFGTVDKTDKGHLVWSGIVRTLPLRLAWPLRWRAPRRIFVCNLADLFHPKVPFEFIAAAWGVMAACEHHTFQVLTKHPRRMLEFLRWLDGKPEGPVRASLLLAQRALLASREIPRALVGTPWPLRNVHLGVTAGDQKRADERLPSLMVAPAVKRFLSYEPAIGPVDLRNLRGGEIDALTGDRKTSSGEVFAGAHGLDLVIAGGESGPRARPAHPDWFRKVRDDCAAARVAFHFKQWGAWIDEKQMLPDGVNVVDRHIDEGGRAGALHDWSDGFSVRVGKKAAGRYLDGRTHDERVS